MSRNPNPHHRFATRVRKRLPGKQGFALIVTLSLMILLVIVAVGLLGLASISLRSSGQGQARAVAQANARMALQMAIGDLQKTLGPDQRISARASLVQGDKGEGNLIGAWESWRWDPFGGSSPDYAGKKQRFKGWLVSASTPKDATNIDFATSAPANPIWLLGPPKTGAPTPATGDPIPQMRASLVTVKNSAKQSGGMAFAVMDESLKAPIHLPEGLPSSAPAVNEIAWRTSPPRSLPEGIVPQLAPSATLKPERMITLPTAVVASTAPQNEILGRESELTTSSLGLQTDVVKGGFKKDLTTAFETTVKLADVFGAETAYGDVADGGLKWDYLRSHYQLYKRVSGASSGMPKVVLNSKELSPTTVGVRPSPDAEKLLPVIAKLQIMFSIVTHHSHIEVPPNELRVSFFNTKATNPSGNTNYGCPHLVYDPVVTLYNPYDVAIELSKLRVRIWDPPVLFGFKKNNVWLRDDFASQLQGLARFQHKFEKDTKARKSFTLMLTEKMSAAKNSPPGKQIRLEPGEVKVFSPWVEDNWTWDFETKSSGDGFKPRVFFDWNADNDFGNKDSRTTVPPQFREFGVHGVPGWDPRAGLQTDHLSYGGARPQATRYDFEIANGMNGGWLGIKLNDTFSVVAKPGRAITDPALKTAPDFAVDLLAGQVANPASSDLLRSYSFRLSDVAGEIAANSAAKLIERTFKVGNLLQTGSDPSAGGKLPFSILTMSAKTTKDLNDVSMPWLHNHPVTEGGVIDTTMVGNALDSYDLRFEECGDFNTFPGIEIDNSNKAFPNRGFYGASVTANRGVSNVPMFRVPLLPANSLGDLIPANLAASSALPRVTHPFGGSRAHPLLPSDSVVRASPVKGAGRMLDHSYLLNDALWDGSFFSTLGSFSGGLSQATTRKSLLSEFFSGEGKLLNSRLVPMLSTRESATSQANTLDGLAPIEFTKQIAGSLAVAGAFNINSDSVTAWRVILGSMRDQSVRGWKNFSHDSKDRVSYPRMGMSLGGDGERTGATPIGIRGQIRWAGFRALTDTQIETLAKAIVAEIRRRGAEDQAPSLSLAEFVNRRVGLPTSLHTLSGLLETAIQATGFNKALLDEDSNTVTGSEPLHKAALAGLAQPEARLGKTAEGAPSVLTQGDLLMPLSGVITARGDTFRVRTYGEARDAAGKPTARAWCEAVVQRMPEYLDPADKAENNQSELGSKTNQTFGRRFIITSFRWLDADEI